VSWEAPDVCGREEGPEFFCHRMKTAATKTAPQAMFQPIALAGFSGVGGTQMPSSVMCPWGGLEGGGAAALGAGFGGLAAGARGLAGGFTAVVKSLPQKGQTSSFSSMAFEQLGQRVIMDAGLL